MGSRCFRYSLCAKRADLSLVVEDMMDTFDSAVVGALADFGKEDVDTMNDWRRS
jgi:hypothetical protein